MYCHEPFSTAKICIKYRKYGNSSFSHTLLTLFLKCPKSCQMAGHNFKIHFNFLFMILQKKAFKMLKIVFSLIESSICFMMQIHEFLKSLTRTNILFQCFLYLLDTNICSMATIMSRNTSMMGFVIYY